VDANTKTGIITAIVSCVVGVLTIVLMELFYVSGLKEKIETLGRENTVLQNKVDVRETYINIIAKQVRDGTISREDLHFLLPENEVKKVNEKLTSGGELSIYVLEPTWIKEKEFFRVIYNQIVIRASIIAPRWANFDLEIPDQYPLRWSYMKEKTRLEFSYKGGTYFLALLEISGDSVKIDITKKL
jgi:hypothetical protein